MSTPSPEIPDAEARILWKRASELQAAEERARTEPPALSTPQAGGYSLREVLDAAEDAGIDRDYVLVSLAESGLPDGDEARPDRWTARVMRYLTGSTDAIEVAKVIPAPPAAAVAAFEEVVSRPAFQLVPENRVGPDPPLDGVAVYRIDPPSFGGSSFHGAMTVADARVVLLTARSEGKQTVLRLRLPVFEHGVNLAITSGLAGGLGLAAGFGGSTAGGALAAALGSASFALVAGPAALGAAVGGVLGVAGFRRLNRWGRRKGEAELHRLLQAVALDAESRFT